MIYSIAGKLAVKSEHFVVVEISGIGFKIFINKGNAKSLSALGADIKLFCYLNVKEVGMELY